MIDNLSILLSHALLLFMFFHVIYRDDLDDEAPPPKIDLDADTSRYRPIRAVKKGNEVKVDADAKPAEPAPYRRATPAAKGTKGPIGRRHDA